MENMQNAKLCIGQLDDTFCVGPSGTFLDEVDKEKMETLFKGRV